MEEWRSVVGYEGWYEVSNLGRVRRVREGRRTYAGLVLRLQTVGGGYANVHLYRDGVQQRRRVHRLVAEAFLGPCPVGKEVNHRNGVKYDNRIANLEYVTPSENARHSHDVLKNQIGSKHPQSKLSDQDVIAIRAARGMTQHQLAEAYGVGQQTISRVLSRRTWRHL